MASRANLLAELGQLFNNRAKLEEELVATQSKRGELGAKCKALAETIAKANQAIREAERELITGLTGMPLLDQAAKNRAEREAEAAQGDEEEEEEKPKKGKGRQVTISAAELGFVHPAIMHALKWNGLAERLASWSGVQCDDRIIVEMIDGFWPKSHKFVSEADGGGESGYTFAAFRKQPAIWIGKVSARDSLTECNFNRDSIVAAARTIYKIPALASAAANTITYDILEDMGMGEPHPKRGRGRPPGAKNRPKLEATPAAPPA